MLYLVATPIGNLKDISFRAIEILNSADFILCEDTRHSSILLNHYEIKKKLQSYHQFSEAKHEERIIEELKSGKTIALISDAGTPGISDPGERLVQACIREGLEVSVIPGPSALIQALVGSGLETTPFQFIGFLPRKEGELKEKLIELLDYRGTSITYESPKRILDVLSTIDSLDPDRQVVVARELTKKFEVYVRGCSKEVLEKLGEEVKGEIVLLIGGNKRSTSWEHLTPEEHVHQVEKDYSVDRKEAIKIVAKQRGVPKRTIYNQFLDD